MYDPLLFRRLRTIRRAASQVRPRAGPTVAYGWFRDHPAFGTRARVADIGSGVSRAQPAFIITFSERHAPRAQDVVSGDSVEIKVWQRDERMRVSDVNDRRRGPI